jgi:uncharacterized membrane protein
VNLEFFSNIYKSHRGEINGAAAGLIIAAAILIFGFFKVLFVLICMGIGYYLGGKISSDKDFLKQILEKIFPPGRYR